MNVVWVSILIATSWSILATSTADRGTDYGLFLESSDCFYPPVEAVVTIVSGQVTSGAPAPGDHTAFGFPQPIVQRGVPNTGTVGAVFRECKDTYGSDEDNGIYVFTCTDNGAYSCTIILEGR